jgi:putative ABC transport system permease protein
VATPLRSFQLAARGLFRRPGFAAVCIVTIAVAIAANTAIFSVVHGTLLRPLPFRDPERLVNFDTRASTGFLISLSIPNYRDWRDRNRAFESLAAQAGWTLRLTERGPAQIVEARAVLGDLFGTLGIPAQLGRVFGAAEAPDHEGGAPVAVLGHRFWQERFGGDPALLGQTLRLGGKNYTVIGVLPPEAGFPNPQVEVYVPMATLAGLPWDDRDSGFGTDALARMRAGVSLAGAREDMARVNREVAQLAGKTASQAEVRSLESYYVGDVRGQLWTLMGAVGFVLLIAVANVGNLLLARGEDRQRELAVRSALGAARGRLVGLLLAEALLIALLGGALGAGLAYLAVGALVPLLPTEIPALLRSHVRVDATVLLFGVWLALLVGLGFGLVPALRSTRVNLAATFKSGSRTTATRSGLRSTLVVVEVALALVLLVSAGLMLKSLDRLLHVDKGFDARNVLTGAVSASAAKIPDAERWRAFYGELRRRAEALPGVRSAAFALLLPLAHRSWELRIHPAGVPVLRETGQSVLYNIVSAEYFVTLGLEFVKGRGFNAGDREGSVPVAIIDETMAAKLWPGDDPLGKQVTFESASDSAGALPVYRTIIGVVKNLRHYELMTASRIEVYVPLDQSGRRWGNAMRIVLKTEGKPEGASPALRALIAELDRDATLWQVQPLEAYVDAATARSRAMSRMLSGFGAGALLLAALGIFGVMSYAVTRKTKEIGIRVALGAAPRDVLRWVAGRALLLTGVGLCGGAVASALLTRVLRKALFEVSPLDASTYIWVALLLGFVALLAAWLPARRASRVDPVAALNEEG